MAFIGKQPGKAAITSTDITDGIITAAKLASDSVTTAKIADNGVTTAKINADAVTDAKIADDVVGTEHLTAGEVDTTALGADAVTAAKIADDAISDEHLDPTAITGQTAETSVADDDLVLVSDTSASAALKKMTVSNLVANAGGGKINQVLQMEYESNQSFTTSANVYNDTAVTLNITPSATSSKIIGWAFYNCGVNSDVYMFLRISRTAPSSAVVCNRIGHTPQSGCVIIDAGSMHFIDSPNTTSQCTYTLQLDTGGGTGRLNDRGDSAGGTGTSGIMLMEVLA